MARFMRKPGFLLARVDQIATVIYASLSGGETLAQAEFLLLLDSLGPVPQISLARAAGTDKSTTGYILDNLQARSWIARTPCDDDRRRARVSLTATGAERIEPIRTAFTQLQRQLESSLAEAAVPQLAAMLHKLGSNPMSPAPLWVPACHPATGVLDCATSFLARRALQLLQAQFSVTTQAINVTLRQFSLLFVLTLRPSISQTGFARMFGIDPSTCAVILRGLVARNLVTVERSPHDRREWVYAITDLGRATLVELHPLVDRSERLVFRGESAAKVRWLVRQLQEIVREHSCRLRFPGALGGI